MYSSEIILCSIYVCRNCDRNDRCIIFRRILLEAVTLVEIGAVKTSLQLILGLSAFIVSITNHTHFFFTRISERVCMYVM